MVYLKNIDPNSLNTGVGLMRQDTDLVAMMDLDLAIIPLKDSGLMLISLVLSFMSLVH